MYQGIYQLKLVQIFAVSGFHHQFFLLPQKLSQLNISFVPHKYTSLVSCQHTIIAINKVKIFRSNCAALRATVMSALLEFHQLFS